jgi:pimeloyl-ACP methyl ester carboxylesterase
VRLTHVGLSTGPRIHYAECGPADGEPIVFVHGWPDSWFSFSRVMPLLPDDVRALAIDQRGFGDSEKPDAGYAIPDLARDVIAFLDAAGIARATLVGHSFGTFVCRQAALADPSRVGSLVLIDTGFQPSNNTVLRELQQSMRELPDPIPIAFAREFQSSTVHHPVPPDFFDRIIEESRKLPPWLWRVAIDRLMAYDDTPQLGRIAAPTLLIWGDHDALFSREEQDHFRAALPSAMFELYEDTGHCPNWERPERVAVDVAAFARSHRA